MKKILAIDNDTEVLELMKSRLQAHQYEVILATDGEEGLKQAEDQRPDLIIVDIKMPKIDGYTFIRQLKRIDESKKTPVIVLTSYIAMKDLFAVEGISDYLVKPFEAEKLLEKIRRLLPA